MTDKTDKTDKTVNRVTCEKHYAPAYGFARIPNEFDMDYRSVMCCGQCLHTYLFHGFPVTRFDGKEVVGGCL